MKIIVTGGAGFIGSHIVDAFVERGDEVHVIDDLSNGKKENVNPKATLHIVDIRDIAKIVSIFKDVDYVFHEAALPRVQYSIENPIKTNEVNVNGLLSILEASRINQVKKVVFASSSSIYGDQNKLPLSEVMNPSPLSPYAAHKYIGEVYCKLYKEVYNLKTVCLRYFNVYGQRLNPEGAYPLVIGYFLKRFKEGKTLTITGDGNQTRDFTHVSDVVNANIKAALSDSVGNGEVINIGGGKQTSINEIASLIGGQVEYIESRLEPHDTLADIKKAKDLLDWQPEVRLKDGIEELKNLF